MGGAVDRVAILLAVLFAAALVVIEFTLYRPQRAKLQAAEAELTTVHGQLAGLARRNLSDQELYRYAGSGTDGSQFRDLYASQSGLIYLTRLIEASGLDRVGFSTEAGRQDAAFRVEVFSVVLRGTYARCLNFVKTLESGARLARIEQLKIEPAGEATGEVTLGMRVSVYGMRQEGR